MEDAVEKLINISLWKGMLRKACHNLKRALVISLACRGGLSPEKVKK
jgi:hypothetical protein